METDEAVRKCFPQQLNCMQTACVSIAFGTDLNFVLSAPTSSGKTTVLAMAMVRTCDKN